MISSETPFLPGDVVYDEERLNVCVTRSMSHIFFHTNQEWLLPNC